MTHEKSRYDKPRMTAERVALIEAIKALPTYPQDDEEGGVCINAVCLDRAEVIAVLERYTGGRS